MRVCSFYPLIPRSRSHHPDLGGREVDKRKTETKKIGMPTRRGKRGENWKAGENRQTGENKRDQYLMNLSLHRLCKEGREREKLILMMMMQMLTALLLFSLHHDHHHFDHHDFPVYLECACVFTVSLL